MPVDRSATLAALGQLGHLQWLQIRDLIWALLDEAGRPRVARFADALAALDDGDVRLVDCVLRQLRPAEVLP